MEENSNKEKKTTMPFVSVMIENIKKGEYDSELYNSAGLTLIRQGRFDEAEKIFNALLEKEKEQYKGRNLNNLGLIYLARYEISKAREYFRKAYEYDIETVGKKVANQNPAWKNLQLANQVVHIGLSKETVEKKVREVDPKGKAAETKFWDMIYGDFIIGGIMAGAIMYSFQVVLDEIATNLDPYVKLSISSFVALTAFLFVYFRYMEKKKLNGL